MSAAPGRPKQARAAVRSTEAQGVSAAPDTHGAAGRPRRLREHSSTQVLLRIPSSAPKQARTAARSAKVLK